MASGGFVFHFLFDNFGLPLAGSILNGACQLVHRCHLPIPESRTNRGLTRLIEAMPWPAESSSDTLGPNV